MANQMVFKRYEIKYLMTRSQRDAVLEAMEPYMSMDAYGHSSIRNIYYDTPDFRLIRESLDKPVYKEKLRVRSYGPASAGDEVFVELKKKVQGVVYKRRIAMPGAPAEACLSRRMNLPDSQIGREIAWFQKCWKAKPKVWIAYDRVGYEGSCDPDLRITLDRNMRWRDTGLDLRLGDYGNPLLCRENILMEIKIPGVCPLWLSHLLSENGIFPVSFSKYGSCYRDHLLRKERNEKEKEGICCA